MRRFLIPMLVLTVGLSISCWAFFSMRNAETERAFDEFERRANNISSVLSDGIDGYATAMDTLTNITSVRMRFSTDYRIDQVEDYKKLREEWGETKVYFNQMALDARGSFPGLQGLGWVAVSPYSELKDLEIGGKFLISPDYEIREVNSDGELCDVSERDEHFPVFYIEPMEQNKIALGIDLAGAGVTRRAIIEARDSGEMTSTPPLSWIRVQTGQLGFCVFGAVYKNDLPTDTVEQRRENLHSFALGVVLIDDMLNSSMRGLDEEGLEFFVCAYGDEIEFGTRQATPVYSSNGQPETFEGFREAAALSGLQWNSAVDVLGRDWSVYCYPQPEFLSGYRSGSPIIALFAGVLITLMLAFYIFRSAGRTQKIAALVDERTLELSLSNEKLHQEMASRVEADKHRDELQSQLLQTQKMESVGQLAGGIAHDFNNILVAIIGYSELIQSNTDSKEAVEEYIDEVRVAADRAAKLTAQLLAFSRRQIIKPEPLDLNQLISGLNDMLRRLIPENIVYAFSPGLMTTSVVGDSSQLEQILVNLILNARDAMPDGGTLTIRTQEVTITEQDARIQNWSRPGNFTVLQVEDTGHGVPEEIRERIFDPFYTTKETGAGTGLGLSVVFGIVEQHSGFIHVDSAPEGGALFSVYLPSCEDTPARVEQPVLREPKGGSETILVVEDDKQVRRIAVHILEGAGHHVLQAANGEEAIRLFDEKRLSIDLVLLDVVMPKLGGREVMNHIRESGSDVPIIFASGYSENGIHTKFILDEGLDLLSKPYSSESLLRRLRERLDSVASRT